jgi:hypothetical protein
MMSGLIPVIEVLKYGLNVGAGLAVFCGFYAPLMGVLKRFAVGCEGVAIGKEMV